LRFFFIVLSVRARSELIVFVLLDELKRSHEDYRLLAVAFSLSMVNWSILSPLEMVEVV